MLFGDSSSVKENLGGGGPFAGWRELSRYNSQHRKRRYRQRLLSMLRRQHIERITQEDVTYRRPQEIANDRALDNDEGGVEILSGAVDRARIFVAFLFKSIAALLVSIFKSRYQAISGQISHY